MRLRQIEVFYTVFSTGSISRAADLLGVSQPAVSKVLRHTEDVLGYQLFERANSGLIPTREGNELYGNAAKIFAELERFRSRIRTLSHSGPETIRIAFAPSIGLSIGPKAVATFLGQNPAINIEIGTLHLHEASMALQSGDLDIAIVYEPHPQPGIRNLPLAKGEFVAVRPKKHEQEQQHRIRLADLQDDGLIRLNSDAPLGNMLNSHLEHKLEVASPQVTANTYYIAKMLVARGMGTAIVDEITARAPPHDGIEIAKIESPLEFTIAAMVRSDEPMSQQDKQLIDVVKTVLDEELVPSA